MTDEEIRKAFARNLVAAMQEKQIGPSELARISGLSRWTIDRYLSGITSPKITDLEKLAAALGKTRYQLLIF